MGKSRHALSQVTPAAAAAVVTLPAYNWGMPSKQVALEVAEFLDSDQARGLGSVDRARWQRLIEAFLSASYEDLGKAPRFLDGQELEGLLAQSLPARLESPKDAEVMPDLLRAYFAHVRETQLVSHAFEIEQALEIGMAPFLAAVRSGKVSGRAAAPAAPYVHGAPKLGRNDPCSCGSGKKYKKCHGKDS